MSNIKIWINGIIILIIYVIVAEGVVAFGDYVYNRIGINRNHILLTLWILPIIVSAYTSYNVRTNKVLFGLSYVFILTFLYVIAHYINGLMGGSVDFINGNGLVEWAKISLFIATILCSVGTFFGIVFSK